MDVDHALLVAVDDPLGQDEHVTSEDDEVGRGLVEQGGEPLLLTRTVAVDRQVVERDVEARRDVGDGLVVGRDERDVDRELAERGANEDVADAVRLTRREERDARPSCAVVELPVHRELRREGRERVAQLVHLLLLRVDVELDALQEQVGDGIGVLIGFDDVAAAGRDERTDLRDDARSVGTREQQDGSHRCQASSNALSTLTTFRPMTSRQ